MSAARDDGTSQTTRPAPARRGRATRRSVVVVDRAADWLIRVGGIGVIVAVFGIMAFLAEVVVPLFLGAEPGAVHDVPRAMPAERLLAGRVDEYKTMAVALTEAGGIAAVHIRSGRRLPAGGLDLGGRRPTAFAATLDGRDLAFGFADGSLALGTLRFEVAVIPADRVPAGATVLDERDSTDGTAVYSRIGRGQVRRIALAASLDEPQAIAPGAAIVAIDYRLGGTVERPTRSFVTVDAAGVARLSLAETRKNLLTGRARTTVETAELPGLPGGVRVADVLMTEQADQVYVAEASGRVFRYDTRDFASPALAETVDLAPGEAELTTLGFLIGEQSIVAGLSTGAVDVYFRLPRAGARSTDGHTLVRAHALEAHGAAVVAFDPSQRGKMFVTADARGGLWLRHATSEQTLLKLERALSDRAPRYRTVALAPREDGVVAIAEDGRLLAWDVRAPHPETTLATIFGKVWYEGYGEPTYTWQSSSGTDSFEPKLSLVPLIFGTLKATVYALLMAVPIALAAAIYTSEFVHHRVRAVVKPTMEMMASLPSVVLGFIAALILAPLVETWIAAVVLGVALLPLSLFAAAYLWQLLPAPLALRYRGLPKFALMFLVLAAAAEGAVAAGPLFERLVFAGDFQAWANGDVGSDAPFLALLLLPVAVALVSAAGSRLWGERHAWLMRTLPRPQAGALDLARWALVMLAAAILAYLAALALAAAGLGPRGGMVDTYVQRNALVVGFAMGFAVIPIVYTIAEDALNAVPEHLRAASLACGATPWQTALRVILPTAMSGVFAAVMIGMGRAVGETMIVVMAAGNTPLIDWNVFNGLRALSANIAVELPEAVRDSTLYRMLFLAALTLFVMTFVVNTVAEIVRLRFRRRAASL